LDADEVLPDSDEEKAEKDSDEESDGGGAGEDSDEEEEEDDDTEALMAELNKIKRERAAEQARQEAERAAREEKIRVENILKGNPLLGKAGGAGAGAGASDFRVKRRWDDDVVFKNCAKMDEGKKKEFINDTLRSEFHKKFMNRYVR
jgi:protein CWC15